MSDKWSKMSADELIKDLQYTMKILKKSHDENSLKLKTVDIDEWERLTNQFFKN